MRLSKITVLPILLLAGVFVFLLYDSRPRRHNVVAASIAGADNLLQECLRFAKSHHSHAMPSHFAELRMEPAFRGVSLSTYATHTSPPSLHTDWTLRDNRKEITAEVDAHCDYIYLGAGLIDDPTNKPSGIILFYSKQDLTDGTVPGRIVAFLDGATRFVPESQFSKLLTDDALHRKSRPIETPAGQPTLSPRPQ